MFKVGTVCIAQNHTKKTYLNGVECTVIAPLASRKWKLGPGFYDVRLCYGVMFPDGKRMLTMPHRLRLRKPKEKHLGEQAVLDLFKVREAENVS